MAATTVDLFTSDAPIKEFGIRIPVLSTLGSQVSFAKENILNCEGYFPLAKSRAHITIASLGTSFVNSKRIEEALNHLKNMDCFTLNIREITYSAQADRNGFGTALLSIDHTNEFSRVQNNVKARVSHLVSSKYSNYPKPHITITKYPSDQIEKVQKLLDSLAFEKDYLVTEVELLHRDIGKGWDWSKRYAVKLK